MINKFEVGKSYIFDMEEYINDPTRPPNSLDILEDYWIQLCNQKRIKVIDEYRGVIEIKEDDCTYTIIPSWCKEVSSVYKMIIKDEEIC